MKGETMIVTSEHARDFDGVTLARHMALGNDPTNPFLCTACTARATSIRIQHGNLTTRCDEHRLPHMGDPAVADALHLVPLPVFPEETG